MADPPNQSEQQQQQEVSKLEEEVKEMCEKISEYRDNMPHHLHNTLTSFLSSHQTPLHLNSSSNPISEENGALVEGDPTHAEKIQTIKQKISSNASAMSSLLKRMKDCMSRIDKLESFNKGSHPAFKRRKITS